MAQGLHLSLYWDYFLYHSYIQQISGERLQDHWSSCFLPTEAAAACEAGLQAVIVDRSIEQEGGIELDEEVRKNFPVIDNLNELFGEEDEDDEEFAQV